MRRVQLFHVPTSLNRRSATFSVHTPAGDSPQWRTDPNRQLAKLSPLSDGRMGARLLTTPEGAVSFTWRSPRHVWVTLKSTSTCSITKLDSVPEMVIVLLIPVALMSGIGWFTVLVGGANTSSVGTLTHVPAISTEAPASSRPKPRRSL